MIQYPSINPVALQLGPVAIHWYGIMYLLGFGLAWLLARHRAQQDKTWTPNQISDLIFYSALGVVLGGRIGYILFYDFANFLAQPLIIFKIWQGGMSFHGGFCGVLIALLIYSRRYHKNFFSCTDFIAPLVPIGLGLGRIGNFINGELWGRITEVPWAMVFPQADLSPRHPSQLYEAFFEGLVLFLILWIYSAKPRPRMAISGLFALGYGLFRITLEYFREPDIQIGFLFSGWLTEGQLLSIPLIIIGILLLYLAYQKPSPKQAD